MKGLLSKFLPVRPKIQLEGRCKNVACVPSSSSYSTSVSNPVYEVHLVWPGNWIIRSRTDLNVVGLCPPIWKSAWYDAAVSNLFRAACQCVLCAVRSEG